MRRHDILIITLGDLPDRRTGRGRLELKHSEFSYSLRAVVLEVL
jgi:hypothetical protein